MPQRIKKKSHSLAATPFFARATGTRTPNSGARNRCVANYTIALTDARSIGEYGKNVKGIFRKEQKNHIRPNKIPQAHSIRLPRVSFARRKKVCSMSKFVLTFFKKFDLLICEGRA